MQSFAAQCVPSLFTASWCAIRSQCDWSSSKIYSRLAQEREEVRWGEAPLREQGVKSNHSLTVHVIFSRHPTVSTHCNPVLLRDVCRRE